MPKNSSKKTVTVESGFRQADLDRALRSARAAGYLVERIEIVDNERTREHVITLTTVPVSDVSGYLSVAEVVAYAGVGKSAIYDMITAGTLQTKKQSGRTLVSKTSIDKFLAGRRKPA